MPPKRMKKTKEPTYNLPDAVKVTILNASYIGKKGYTIPLSIIPEKELSFLKKDLYLKPQIPGPAFAQTTETAFPVYRENINKIYIPRFYGIERYGLPERNEIDDGEDISVSFPMKLRDYQENIVDIYKKHISQPNGTNCGGGILEVFCGSGKCVGLNTPIMQCDGTIKMVQDIVVGDLLMGDDSTPRKVLTLARGREQMYRVVPNKGDSYVVNESHILSLKCSSNYNKKYTKNSIHDISVLDFLKLPATFHGRAGPLVGYRVPITFPKKVVEIDPYLLGFWLGDGWSRGAGITTQDSTVLKYLVSDCFQNKHPSLYLQYTGSQYDYRINSINKKATGSNCFNNSLRNYNLINNKHIPRDYKCNERQVQLELLAGLIDSDGCYHNNCYEILQKNETLMDDIIYLARSLGFAAYKTQCKKSCMYKGEKKEGTYYRTVIHGKGLDEVPVKCPRKKVTPRKQIKNALHTRIRLEKMEVDNYYGFEIDGNRRFVLGDCTVTHNTVMALKIIEMLQKKTLILVHKEFLMNQWIERIEEFLPGARVGKIQASVCDCEDKDIVIGMIQTMYNKTFPQEVYSQFGLTIIDEVHRIGSEEFSKTLLKTITPCMLGISATVERKDKLTKLLYMFIGPKIHSMVRKQDDVVNVRGIEYITADTEFNTVEYDYRGNTKFSTMISKLSNFGPRSDFVVRVVHDLLIENPEGQVMVLCHNRCLLTYLYESITNKGINTVGYYVGGMKQTALEDTETKQIVLATYAMAAEALDIKTLSMLVMASPKTDITQSVGRILRVKHDNPVIVDIVDSHELFQRQWLQRKRFYKKSNYPIRYIKSSNYTGMNIVWENDELWSMLYDPNNKGKSGKRQDKQDVSLVGKCMIDIDG
jgi:superfamily II DNA or RNA helicase